MGKKKAGQAEKLLSDLGKTIDEFISKSKDSSGTFKKEWDERLEELKRNKKTLEDKFASFRKEHADDFEKFESKLQETADEVKEAFEKLFGKQKKQ